MTKLRPVPDYIRVSPDDSETMSNVLLISIKDDTISSKKNDSIYMIPRAPAAQYNHLLEGLTLMPIMSISEHIHYAKIYVQFMIELPPKGLAEVTWRKDRPLFYL
jgi:hypothetical protein